MTKYFITLKPSEQAILGAAATIFAGYASASRIPEDEENKWLKKSLKQALQLAKLTDDSVQADGEFD